MSYYIMRAGGIAAVVADGYVGVFLIYFRLPEYLGTLRQLTQKDMLPKASLFLLAIASSSSALQTISRVGRYLYGADGNRFYIKVSRTPAFV